MSFLPTAADLGRRAALVMLVSLLLCYGLAAVGVMGWPMLALFVVFLVGAALSLLGLRELRVAIPVLVVLALVGISLGSPGDAWDPRSIWLFHAKRIYLDGTLYAQLDDYAPWSHNDYPALVPLLMAAAAGLLGHWNELLPKAVAPLLLLPALLLIAPGLRSRGWVALLALLLLRVGREMLVNGYMDTLVALYALTALVLAMRLRGADDSRRLGDIVALALVVAVLSLLKNEGAVLAAVVVGSVVLEGALRERRLCWRVLLAFVVALLPLLAWKTSVAAAHISNDLAGSDLQSQLLVRLTTDGGSAMILKRLLLDEWMLAPLLVLAVLWRRVLQRPLAAVALLAALGYIAVLFLVYLSTPQDLAWHLQTSAVRVRQPVVLALFLAATVAVWRADPAAPATPDPR